MMDWGLPHRRIKSTTSSFNKLQTSSLSEYLRYLKVYQLKWFLRRFDYSTSIKVNKWIDSFNDKWMIIIQVTVKHWKFLPRLNKFQLNDQKLTINKFKTSMLTFLLYERSESARNWSVDWPMIINNLKR